MVFREAFTNPVFLRFLRRLLCCHVPRPVFLIIDRHPVHLANEVQLWVARPPDRFQLFFLPSSSPDLNPDEVLNRDVKSKPLGRRLPREAVEPLTTVRLCFWGTQRQPANVHSYFQPETVGYAA